MPVAKGQKGVEQEMRKFSKGMLHSGSKQGPIVKNRKQAIAIAMHQAGQGKGPKQTAKATKQKFPDFPMATKTPDKHGRYK